MSQSKKTKRLVLLSLFIGIETVLMVTPLGYIPIGAIKATTLHIPVLVISMLLGIKEGAFLGLFFGISSVVISTFNPSLFSFCFSPFYSIGEIHGNMGSLVVALLPRILLGVVGGFVYRILPKQMKLEHKAALTGLIGSLLHTILVLSGIYFFFGKEYASVAGFAYETFLNVIKVTIFTNGIAEAILASIISMVIIQALSKKGALYE